MIFLPALADSLVWSFRTIANDYNEGWNAFFADRAYAGALYPGAGDMVINNYPPLSFYIVGALGHLVGSNIVAGRLLSVAAFATVAATIWVIVSSHGRSIAIGAFAAAYYATLFNILPGRRLGLDDPQLLGHAFATIGLAVIFFGAERFSRLFLAALLMVVAGLVKHSLVAVPLAVTLWIAIQDRRALGRWLAAMLAAGALGALVLVAAWGPAAIAALLSPRGFSLMKLARDTQKAILWLDVPLAIWVIQVSLGNRNRHFLLGSCYVISSLLILPLFFGGFGTNANIAFDLVIALALTSGLGLATQAEGRLSMALALTLAISAIVSTPGSTIEVLAGGAKADAAAERATLSDVQYLARQGDPALCENLALCYWARKGFLYDAFNMGQAYRAGARDEEPMLALLRSRTIAVIELDTVTSEIPDRFDSRFHETLDANYVLDRSGNDRFFYIPRKN